MTERERIERLERQMLALEKHLGIRLMKAEELLRTGIADDPVYLQSEFVAVQEELLARKRT